MAASLRTDQKSYKRVQIDDPAVIRLRELSRMDEELKDDLRRSTNRLWEQLRRFYPQVLQLSPAADDLFVWELLRIAPTPEMGAKMSRHRVEELLAAHRISRFTADEALAILRSSPLKLAPGSREAASERVLLLLPVITLLDKQVRDVERRVKQLLKALCGEQNEETSEVHDLTVMLSIPGVGPGIASTLYSEASRPIRDRDYEALRCYAGTAPVTKQSAKRKAVSMRHACNPRIRQAVHHWANRSIACDPRSRQQYDSLRVAGHLHARAIRGLADRLLSMLIAMLRKGEQYDAERRSVQA
jgi:Transposase IS116/IS110/IS902 family